MMTADHLQPARSACARQRCFRTLRCASETPRGGSTRVASAPPYTRCVTRTDPHGFGHGSCRAPGAGKSDAVGPHQRRHRRVAPRRPTRLRPPRHRSQHRRWNTRRQNRQPSLRSLRQASNQPDPDRYSTSTRIPRPVPRPRNRPHLPQSPLLRPGDRPVRVGRPCRVGHWRDVSICWKRSAQ